MFILIRSLPWNQRTLSGWIGLNIFSMFAAPLYLFINYAFLSFFIGICEHHQAFYKYFKASIQKLNATTEVDYVQRKCQLVNLIRFHKSTRE